MVGIQNYGIPHLVARKIAMAHYDVQNSGRNGLSKTLFWEAPNEVAHCTMELVLGITKEITLVPYTQFKRSKYEGTVYNIDLTKTITCSYDKRRIMPNYDTLPFGYVENLH